jgi:hypothetical protein
MEIVIFAHSMAIVMFCLLLGICDIFLLNRNCRCLSTVPSVVVGVSRSWDGTASAADVRDG